MGNGCPEDALRNLLPPHTQEYYVILLSSYWVPGAVQCTLIISFNPHKTLIGRQFYDPYGTDKETEACRG